jgi:Na+-driven multidrug efflux pump
LGPGSPLKNILKTSLPAVVDLSSQTIMFTVEAIFIGRISTGAFAGQGLAIQVVIAFLTILITFIVGSSLIVARHVGAEERQEANHVFGQALMISIVISFVFAIVWYFGGVHLFKLIEEGGSIEAQRAGSSYLRMIINVSINGLNLLLAPLFIFGWFGFPRWEVEGAAIALGISHSVGFLITLYILRTRKSVLFLSFRELTRPNFKTFKRLLKAGIPTTVEQLVWALGLLVVSIYAARLGEKYLAAHIVLNRIQNILSMAYLGFSLTAMTLMGKNLGAEKQKLAERTARTAGWVGFIFSFAIAMTMVIFSKSILYLFTPERAVIAIGVHAMTIFALVQVPKAVDNVIIGNLRGAGDLKWLMYMTIIGVFFLEVCLNWVVAFKTSLALAGLWSVHLLDETLRLGANYWRFKGGRWKFMKV